MIKIFVALFCLTLLFTIAFSDMTKAQSEVYATISGAKVLTFTDPTIQAAMLSYLRDPAITAPVPSQKYVPGYGTQQVTMIDYLTSEMGVDGTTANIIAQKYNSMFNSVTAISPTTHIAEFNNKGEIITGSFIINRNVQPVFGFYMPNTNSLTAKFFNSSNVAVTTQGIVGVFLLKNYNQALLSISGASYGNNYRLNITRAQAYIYADKICGGIDSIYTFRDPVGEYTIESTGADEDMGCLLVQQGYVVAAKRANVRLPSGASFVAEKYEEWAYFKTPSTPATVAQTLPKSQTTITLPDGTEVLGEGRIFIIDGPGAIGNDGLCINCQGGKQFYMEEGVLAFKTGDIQNIYYVFNAPKGKALVSDKSKGSVYYIPQNQEEFRSIVNNVGYYSAYAKAFKLARTMLKSGKSEYDIPQEIMQMTQVQGYPVINFPEAEAIVTAAKDANTKLGVMGIK